MTQSLPVSVSWLWFHASREYARRPVLLSAPLFFIGALPGVAILSCLVCRLAIAPVLLLETGMAEEPSAAVRELEEDAALPAGPLLNHLKLSAIHTLRSPRCPAARPRHHLARLRVVLFEGQLGKNRMEKCMSTAAGGSSSPAPASPEVHVAAWASTSAGGSSSPAPGFGEVGFGVHVEVVRISSSGWPTMACRRACHLPAPAHDSTSWFQHRTSSRSGGW